MANKKIKVQYSSRSTGGTYWQPSRYTVCPKIQMEGKWLEALGFHIGVRLNVEYEEGRIILTLAPQTETAMVAEDSGKYAAGRRKVVSRMLV